MNAIINSLEKDTEEALDCHVYHIEKCFDAVWLHEVINCLYAAGLNNYKLLLLQRAAEKMRIKKIAQFFIIFG